MAVRWALQLPERRIIAIGHLHQINLRPLISLSPLPLSLPLSFSHTHTHSHALSCCVVASSFCVCFSDNLPKRVCFRGNDIEKQIAFKLRVSHLMAPYLTKAGNLQESTLESQLDALPLNRFRPVRSSAPSKADSPKSQMSAH